MPREKKITKAERPPKSKKPAKPAGSDILYRNLDQDSEVSVYYGFQPIPFPEINKSDRLAAAGIARRENLEKTSCLPPSPATEQKIAVLRNYLEKKWEREPQPILISYQTRDKGSKEKNIGLEILGTEKSVAEAIIIKTMIEILKEEGFSNLYVNLNSIGERDSTSRYSKEVGLYFRKHLDELAPSCRQLFRKDPLSPLCCVHEKCAELREHCPKPISFLSEPNRNHFKEVLEYVEFLEIPYRIKHFLINNRAVCCKTIFEIRDESKKAEDQPPLAAGFRFDGLSRKIGFRKELPAVGIQALFTPEIKEGSLKTAHKINRPKIYFIQLGFEAKLKSLKIIEMLRQAKIPIYQSLSRDKFASQLAVAENLKIPYTIIMGQKEAVEDSIIVREMASRSQETVKIPDLPAYLKKLR
jgi:histidyl-tRNA synthetase